MHKKLSKGFTLIEMMIVVLVIAILALIVGLAVRNAGDRSKSARFTADVAALENAGIMFRNDTGVFPTAVDSVIAAEGASPEGTSNYQGPYLSRTTAPTCPWCGSAYQYDAQGLVTCSVGGSTNAAH